MREPSAEIDQWAHRVIGAAIEVHRHLGPGLLEAVYEEALAHEFDLLGVPYARQPLVEIPYKTITAGTGRCDFIVTRCLPVELKATEGIHPVFIAQTMNDLRALEQPLALIIKFNVMALKDGIRRAVLSH